MNVVVGVGSGLNDAELVMEQLEGITNHPEGVPVLLVGNAVLPVAEGAALPTGGSQTAYVATTSDLLTVKHSTRQA